MRALSQMTMLAHTHMTTAARLQVVITFQKHERRSVYDRPVYGGAGRGDLCSGGICKPTRLTSQAFSRTAVHTPAAPSRVDILKVVKLALVQEATRAHSQPTTGSQDCRRFVFAFQPCNAWLVADGGM